MSDEQTPEQRAFREGRTVAMTISKAQAMANDFCDQMEMLCKVSSILPGRMRSELGPELLRGLELVIKELANIREHLEEAMSKPSLSDQAEEKKAKEEPEA